MYLCGEDSQGIGAVVALANIHGAPQPTAKLMLIAVASRYRLRGGLVADEAVTIALEQALALTKSERAVIVALVDRRNRPSVEMLKRASFANMGVATGALDVWQVNVDQGE